MRADRLEKIMFGYRFAVKRAAYLPIWYAQRQYFNGSISDAVPFLNWNEAVGYIQPELAQIRKVFPVRQEGL